MAGTAPPVTEDELLLERVQHLQERLDSVDPQVRELADELVSAIIQMYGSGLERIAQSLSQAGQLGEQVMSELTEDPLVAPLLLIHDLHPVPLSERVSEALERVRPYMESHGGDVELLSLADGVARLRLRGSCSDCAASAVTLELAIKQALEELAPDLMGLEVEGVDPAASGPSLPMAGAGAGGAAPAGMELPIAVSPAPSSAPSWLEVEHVDALAVGGLAAAEIAGAQLVVANVEGTLLAYRDRCAGCGGPLRDGQLRDGALGCPRCERTFFLPRAGRSMDDDALQLEPVPLLREGGRVKVALAP